MFIEGLAIILFTMALLGAAIGVVVGCVSCAVLENGWRAILRSMLIASPVFVLSWWAVMALGPQETGPWTINSADGTSSTIMVTTFQGEPRYFAGLAAMAISLSVEALVSRARRKGSATVP
jgi:hypothetical protein